MQNLASPSCSSALRLRASARRGSTATMLALMLPVVLAIAAFVINVVYMEMTRTELQITIDVATRAAGRVLSVTGSQQEAIAAAEDLMRRNPFANQTMTLSGSDIVFGVSSRQSEAERYSFTAGAHPNAVQIQANGNMRVPMLFPTMGVPIQFRPIKTSISTTAELDLALVLDRSGSMAFASDEVCGDYNPAAAPPGWTYGDPVPPNARWLDAVDAVRSFLDLMEASGQDERICMSSYNDRACVDTKLSSSYAEIDNAMQAYSQKFEQGATNIGDGILAGATALGDKGHARPWASRVMIVLTDGNHNTGTDPLYAAQIAAAENILIFTITFSDEADTTRMKQVAEIGAGKHFHALNHSQLVEAFDEIAHRLPNLITY